MQFPQNAIIISPLDEGTTCFNSITSPIAMGTKTLPQNTLPTNVHADSSRKSQRNSPLVQNALPMTNSPSAPAINTDGNRQYNHYTSSLRSDRAQNATIISLLDEGTPCSNSITSPIAKGTTFHRTYAC